MDYKSHYDRLIERASSRVLAGYVEVHHIVPRCMGGTEDLTNLVQLTAREHFVAHQLLYKMYPEVKGLAYSLTLMLTDPHGFRNHTCYSWIRKAYGLAMKGRVKSAEERKNISEGGKKRKPRKFSDEAKANMSEARKKTWAERRANGTDKEIAAKTKATRTKNGSYEFTEEHKQKISLAGKGRTPWNKGLTLKGKLLLKQHQLKHFMLLNLTALQTT